MAANQENESDVLSALRRYYEMKQRYDRQVDQRKQRILRNPDLSRRQKAQRLRAIRGDCVNCGRSGGTIFQREGSILSATCGSSKDCGLDIRINRGNYRNLYSTHAIAEKSVTDHGSDIVNTKLGIVFGTESKESGLQAFQRQKSDLAAAAADLREVDENLYRIVARPAEARVLEVGKVDMHTVRQELRTMAEDDSAVNYAHEAAERYASVIIPLQKRMQDARYARMETVSEGLPPFGRRLVAEPYTLSQLVVPVKSPSGDKGDARVLSFSV